MPTLPELKEAVQYEIRKFNEAVKKRKEPLIIQNENLLNNGHEVLIMKEDFTLVTKSPDGDTRSWAYCNDDRWNQLLASAGVDRHPLFE